MRKAVVDVGSNSLLLLVEEKTPAGWRPVAERSAVTGLGEGTKATGLLGERGMAASLTTLREMFDQARDTGAQNVTAAATMAVRIAENRDQFLQRAADQGTPVSILSGDDEARLGFESVARDPMFSGHNRLSIIDPGGQSTELTTAAHRDGDWDFQFRRSYPVGTLGLRGDTLAKESPGPAAILEASAAIDDIIGLCYLRGMAGEAVVLGATGTNLVTIREKMTDWEPQRVHGAYLDFEEISRFVESLMRLDDAGRAALVGIERGREGTIHIGALVLERFLSAIGAPGCRVSVRGWRHALLENPI